MVDTTADNFAPFLAAIDAAPTDWLPRLIWADWLDERGRLWWAEALRWAERNGKEPAFVDGDYRWWAPSAATIAGGNYARASALVGPMAPPTLALGGTLQFRSASAAWIGWCDRWAAVRVRDSDPAAAYKVESRACKSAWAVRAWVTIDLTLAGLPADATPADRRKAVSAAYPFGPLTGALRADFRDSAIVLFCIVEAAARSFARCDTLYARRWLELAAIDLAASVRDWQAGFGFYPFAPAREFTRPQQRLYAAALGSARDPAAWRDELLEAARGLAAGEGRG